LNGDTTAIDDGGFRAVDRQWRLMTEIDHCGTPVMSACRPVVQNRRPQRRLLEPELEELQYVQVVP
jgi:hypothetical protein